MANKKITDLTAITSAATDDYIHIVDASDTTDDSAGSSKKIAVEDLVDGRITSQVASIQAWVDNDTYTVPPNTDSISFYDTGYLHVDFTGGDSGTQYAIIGETTKTSGTNSTVGGGFHAYSKGSTGSVWGIATEAWTGDIDTEGTSSATLIGGEFSIVSQYHANANTLVGVDIVFKNRSDADTELEHGGAGDNKYNDNSRAIQISSQDPTSAGEYCGWQTAIYLSDKLDQSTTKAYTSVIDLSAATTDVQGGYPWVFIWRIAAVYFGIRFNTSNQYLEFYRDITGTPARKGYLDMTSGASDHAI